MKILFKQYLAIKVMYYTMIATKMGRHENIMLLKISMEALMRYFTL